MRQTIMLMAACAAVLASCTNEGMNEGLGIDTPIQVTASVEGIMTTRAENTEGNLDNFGLYIKDKDDSYTSNYGGENIEVSKLEGESVWTLANEVLYQGSGQTYFAYAPYQSIEAGAPSVDFTVETDQSGSEYMQASDLLYAAGSVTSPELTINFSHKLCKLTVNHDTGSMAQGTITLAEDAVVTISVENGGDGDPVLGWISVNKHTTFTDPEDYLNAALDQVDIPNKDDVRGNITLSDQVKVDGETVNVTWETSHPEIVDVESHEVERIFRRRADLFRFKPGWPKLG